MSESTQEILLKGTLTLNRPNTNNVNVRDKKVVASIAQSLADKLKDQNSFEFFCKVGWNLSEDIIWRIYEKAVTGKNPKAYFTFLCKLEMK